MTTNRATGKELPLFDRSASEDPSDVEMAPPPTASLKRKRSESLAHNDTSLGRCDRCTKINVDDPNCYIPKLWKKCHPCWLSKKGCSWNKKTLPEMFPNAKFLATMPPLPAKGKEKEQAQVPALNILLRPKQNKIAKPQGKFLIVSFTAFSSDFEQFKFCYLLLQSVEKGLRLPRDPSPVHRDVRLPRIPQQAILDM
jgi:hypothetical protein